MKRIARKTSIGLMAALLGFGAMSFAQDRTERELMKFATGQKVKMSGVIVQKDAESFILRNAQGSDVQVKLSGATAIKEKKSNPFRGAKLYTASHLVSGLNVEVEGLGDADGMLAARDVKFTQTQYMVANSVETRVKPVEGRLSETETRLTQSEENARHLSGELQEVSAISAAAKDGAKAAQNTADEAIAGVNANSEKITMVSKETNARISALDEYEVRDSVVLHFKFGSSALTPEAKAQLDDVAKGALALKGSVVEVTGYASADGDESYNRILSQRRADAVVQYLADNMVPLRRIVTPFGFGEKMPSADNDTRVGREENRRVEVRILTTKALSGDNPVGMVSNTDKKL